MAFPINPIQGQTYTDKKGVTFIFDQGGWVLQTTGSNVAQLSAAAHFSRRYIDANAANRIVSNVGQETPTRIPLLPAQQILLQNVTLNTTNNTLVIQEAGVYRAHFQTTFKSNVGNYAARVRILRNGTIVQDNISSVQGTGSEETQSAEYEARLSVGDVIAFEILALQNNVDVYAIEITLEMQPETAGVGSFTGATAGVAGRPGMVPAPLAGQQDSALMGNGTFGNVARVAHFSRVDGAVRTPTITTDPALTGGFGFGFNNTNQPLGLIILNESGEAESPTIFARKTSAAGNFSLTRENGNVGIANGATVSFAALGTINTYDMIEYYITGRGGINAGKIWRVTTSINGSNRADLSVEYIPVTTL